MGRKLMLINKQDVLSVSASRLLEGSVCYYFSSDYSFFIEIGNSLQGTTILNLEGKFRAAVKELWEPYLEVTAELNRRNNSLHWWGSTIASRNSASTPLFLNIVYLYCADKILQDSAGDVSIIVESESLSQCISKVAEGKGYEVHYFKGNRRGLCKNIKIYFKIPAKILFFLWRSLVARFWAGIRLRKVIFDGDHKKLAVIRSWVNQGNFGNDGTFRDRNFGNLSEFLSAHGYTVFLMPMFFDLSVSMERMFSLLENSGVNFLIPHKYLKQWDYLRMIFWEFRCLKTSFKGIELKNMDVSSIFSDVHLGQVFSPDLMSLNLCVFLLQRLKKNGIKIDVVFYPFENNPPEKTFIIAARTFYPDSKVLAFQHTVWYAEQCGMYLTKADIPEHPVADKIVTSGPIYVEVLKKAGFPENVINLGPSLRFVSLYNNSLQINDNADKSNKIILLPLSFEKNLSFELIHKAGNALEKYSGYEICIRPHPLIPKDELELFLNRLRLRNYIVSSDGTVHEWLRRTHALISTGGTVCILEAAAMGIPVIRLMPDNYFFLDPFASSDYLLKPISRSDQILEQLELIESIMKTDKEAFKKIGDKVLKDYFGMPCQEAMMSFL